jgi:hypothetical protein
VPAKKRPPLDALTRAFYSGVMRREIMVPLDKYDVQALNELAIASDDAVMANASALLEWLQDANWPVYQGVLNRLKPLGDKLVIPISEILRGDDSIWKSWIVYDLIGGFDTQSQALYSDVLKEVLLSASQDDYREGLIDYVEMQLSSIAKNA